MKITFDKDMPSCRGQTLVGGYDIPEELSHVPMSRLRLLKGKVVDIAKVTTIFVDPDGSRHVIPGNGRKSYKMKWDEELLDDGKGGWRQKTAGEKLAPDIKKECGERIRAVLKDDTTQANMLAFRVGLATSSKTSAADKKSLALMEAGDAWVQAMLAACRKMIEDAEADYKKDSKWPAAPDGLADLANKF